MSTETETNPVPAAASAAPATGVDGQDNTVQTSEDIDTEAFDRMPAPVEADGEAGEGDKPAPEAKPEAETKGAAPSDDETEVELSDGRKVKVPKEIALGNLRQADYTQKTQAHAEQVRAFDQERSAWQSQQAESLKAFREQHVAIATAEAQLAKVGEDLVKYRQMTPAKWAELRAQDPALYDQHSENFEQLRRYRTTLDESLDEAKKDLSAREAKAKEEGDKARHAAIAEGFRKAGETLAKDIPGWNEQRWGEVAQFTAKELGYSAEELREATDPRAWKMANEIMQLRAENAKLKTGQKQQAAAETQQKAQATKPAERVAGATPPRGVNDAIDVEAWMQRRNAQVARKGA